MSGVNWFLRNVNVQTRTAGTPERDRRKLTFTGQRNLDLSKMMTAGQKAGVDYSYVEVEEHGSLTPPKASAS